jgi:hypothetical protein
MQACASRHVQVGCCHRLLLGAAFLVKRGSKGHFDQGFVFGVVRMIFGLAATLLGSARRKQKS